MCTKAKQATEITHGMSDPGKRPKHTELETGQNRNQDETGQDAGVCHWI